MPLRKKRRDTKKTLSIIRSQTDKAKLDNKKGLGSKVSNADNVIRPVSILLNTDNEMRSSFSNREREKSGDESIVMICGTIITFLCVFFYLKIFLEMVNTVTLKLLDIHFSVNFETISWIVKKRVIFRINLNKNNYNCSPTLIRLQK